MMPINKRKLTICTKKNPKRTDTTLFVWTRHTCTGDCIMRAAKIATAKTFTVAGMLPYACFFACSCAA
jgi:hypothetical protein